MRHRIFSFAICAAFAAVIVSSCGEGTPPDDKLPVVDTVLTLSSSKGWILNDGVDSAVLRVVHAGQDVTGGCVIECNGEPFLADVFRETAAGNYSFKASYEGLVSNSVVVTVDIPGVDFVHNAAVFDVTSTWCQYCPIGGGTIQRAKKDYAPRVVPLYFHVDHSTPKDPFEMSQSRAMLGWLGGNAFPTIRINNEKTMTGTTLEVEDFAPFISGSRQTTRSGVAINTVYDEAKSELTIDFRARVTDARYVDQDLRLVGWLTEDKLISPQASPNSVIREYEHNDVVRAVLVGDTLIGQAIEGEYIISGKEFVYKKVVKMNQGWKAANCNINAYIYHRKGRATHYDTLLNVQRVAFGESIGFQVQQ